MDGEKTVYHFSVNSLDIEARYYSRDIDEIFVPLSRQLDAMRKSSEGRVIVYLAGPCGAGKTTMSLLLEHLANEHTGSFAQAVGLDGFHHTAEYLSGHYIQKDGKEILMREVKGSAETYDFDKLYGKIAALRRGDAYFPRYSRLAHDVEEDAVFVSGQIVIIEGNWLLLDEPRWRGLSGFADFRIFIGAPREILVRRLIERKIAGGLCAEEAERFVVRSDLENIDRILGRRLGCDLELEMDNDGKYKIIKETKPK